MSHRMSRRPAPTLADFAVIAISPALIMVLVGSLTFFLIEVFYVGQYNGRISFIMAMFVMGAVLIARIAIERGRDYALLFAIPLGAVTALAAYRLVEYSGPLQGFSMLINCVLIGVIWWSANKLTWDSTVIDESKDVSGEGLLQTVGIEDQSSSPPPPSDSRSTTARDVSSPSVWQRFVEHRRRPHAPGVWVIYFSLAALPIFGFGNWFVPGGDLERRRYAFQLLVLYVAAALGLLLTTSFLGLRRYLRQRRLEMPVEMAATWIGTGGVMIVVLLLACTLLPRRNAEYSLTQLPLFAGSPSDLWTTDYAVGSEGEHRPADADRTGDTSGDPSGGNPDDEAVKSVGGRGKGQGSPGQEAQGKGSQGQGAQGKGSQGQGSQGQGAQGKGSPGKGSLQGNASKGKSGESAAGRSSKSSNEKGEKSETNQSGRGSRAGDQQRGEPAGNPKQSQPGSGSDDSDDPDKSGKAANLTDADRERRDGDAEQSQSARTESPAQARRASQPTRRFDPSKIGSAIGGTLGRLMQFVYWLVVLAVVGYLAWRFHREISAALGNFVRSLRALWESLVGRQVAAAEPSEAIPVDVGPPLKPFSSFADPFVTGMAEQQQPAEVVRYSFEAFEAWARERGFPREPKQTPLEYAHAVGRQKVAVARDAAALAELYCRCAYGKGATSRTSLEQLRKLWVRLRSSPA